MTTTPPDPATWAARQVGLPPGATPEELRGALLREVTREGFVPPPERHAAWQALCAPPGARPSPPPEMLLAEETRLRGEVDDFAAEFFATPAAARRQRWQSLSDQCALSPPLTARLAALQPALGLEPDPGAIGNPRTAQLASHVAGLFVLAPAARAAQRQAVLRAMQADLGGWEEAVKQLHAMAPAVAALEPTLLASVRGWRDRQQRLARARQGREPSSRPSPRSLARAKAAPPPAAPAKSSGGGRAVGWGGVVLIGLMVRVCIGMGSFRSHEPDIPRFDPPQFQAPQFDPKVFDDINRLNRENQQKRDEQLERLIQQMRENDKAARPGEIEPGPDEDDPPLKRDEKPNTDPRGGR